MSANKQIAAPTVLDLSTLERVIGGCRAASISPVAPPRTDYSAMLVSSSAELMIHNGAGAFGLDQVGALDQIFAELDRESIQSAAFAASGPAAGQPVAADLDAHKVEEEQPMLRGTLEQGAQAATPDGIHCGTTVIANPSRVVNAHVVSASRAR